MRILKDPHFEEPVCLIGAGGAAGFVFLRTIGDAIDYLDQAVIKDVAPAAFLNRAHSDLRTAQDSRKSEDIAKARDSLVAALDAMKVLMKNSITGRS